MRDRFSISRRAILAGLLSLPAAVVAGHANAACMSFAQARQAGLFSKYKLKPAASVKSSLESKTGGKVVSFEVCEPGPNYKVTVVRPDGVVTQVDVPAR